MPTRWLGALEVPAVGFGAMVLSNVYGGGVDETGAINALDAAVSAGCTFVDTSDSYRGNEELLSRFVAERAEPIVVGTKFGLRLGPDDPARELPVPWDGGSFRVNAEPARVRGYLEASLGRLGAERVDLYYPHFPDPGVPIEATVEAIAALAGEGLVGHVGLSNATVDDLRRAQAVHPIAAVQVEWSMWHPVDPELLARCEATGTGVVAWAPLGRGFLTGALAGVGARDFRTRVERLRGDNLTANNDRFRPVVALAADLAITPAQLALAWLLHQSDVVVPIPGSRTPEHIAENAAAASVSLDPAELAAIDDALARFSPVGDVT